MPNPHHSQRLAPPFFIANVRVVEPGVRIHRGGVLVRNGRIAALGAVDDVSIRGVETLDGQGRLLTPGMIGIHTHGVMHHLYESGDDSFLGASKVLGRFGVTTVAPTVVPRMEQGWLEKLAATAEAIASVRGLTVPGDISLLDEIIAACRRRIAVMSISPDTPNILPVIRWLRENGISAFIIHTRGSVEQTATATGRATPRRIRWPAALSP